MPGTKRSGLELIHQFVYEVVDFSSQYGSENGTSYSAGNLVGPCQVYPNYCDSSATCSFRTFGHWWRECPSAMRPIASPPSGYTSEDYVDLYFDIPVIPARLQIFETYNPGSVVRIVACCRTTPTDGPVNERKPYWVTLWEAPTLRVPNLLQLPSPNWANTTRALVLSRPLGLVPSRRPFTSRAPGVEQYTEGTPDLGEESRRQAHVFQPPLRNVPPFPIDLIRLELDGTRCPYYAELDAVRLTGWAEVSHWSRFNQIEGVIPTVSSNVLSPTEFTDPPNASRSADRSLLYFADLLRPSTPQLGSHVDHPSPQLTSSDDSLPDLVQSTSGCPPPPSQSEQSLTTGSGPAVSNLLTVSKPAASTGLCRIPALGFDLLLPRADHVLSIMPGAICPTSLFGLIRLDETALWRHGPLTRLPYEVLLHIFSFLDLKSICRVARVSRQFRCLADDALAQLTSLNIQAYWPWLKDATLLSLGKRLGQVNLTARAAAVATTGNSVIPYNLLRRLELEKAELSGGPARSFHRHRVGRAVLAARVRSWSTSCCAQQPQQQQKPSLFNPGTSGSSDHIVAPPCETEDSASAGHGTENWTVEDWSRDVLDAYLSAFPHCRLKRLDMSWCGNYSQISPTAFGDFLGDACSRLVSLRLSSCKFVNDDCLLHVVNTCALLEELDLSSCTGITSQGFFLLGRLIHLRWVSLYRTHVNDDGVINMAQLCQYLKHVNLGSCMDIQDMDRVLDCLTQALPNLISLNLWRCVTVSAVGIAHIVRSCAALEELDLGWCRHVVLTQQEAVNCIVQLVQRCTGIRRLILTGTSLLSSEDVILLGQTLRDRLEQLDLLGSENVSIAAIAILLAQCSRLRLLDVSFCHHILGHHVRHLRRIFPSCTIVNAIRDPEADQLFAHPIQHRVLVEELVHEFLERLQHLVGPVLPRAALPAGPNLLALPGPNVFPAIMGPAPER